MIISLYLINNDIYTYIVKEHQQQTVHMNAFFSVSNQQRTQDSLCVDKEMTPWLH